jgi:predicted GNAT family N-acyltransferase
MSRVPESRIHEDYIVPHEENNSFHEQRYDFPISSKGVRIAGTLYNIGIYNDPSYVARRISPTFVAIVETNKDGQEKMVGRFLAPSSEGGVEGVEEVKSAEVLRLTFEEIFGDDADKTITGDPVYGSPEYRAYDFMMRYPEWVEEVQAGLRKDGSSFSLADMSLPEQIDISQFQKKSDIDKKRYLIQLTKAKGGENDLRDYLEHFGEVARDIVKVLDLYTGDDAYKILDRYDKLLSTSGSINAFVDTRFLQDASPKERAFSAHSQTDTFYSERHYYTDRGAARYNKVEPTVRASIAKALGEYIKRQISVFTSARIPSETLAVVLDDIQEDSVLFRAFIKQAFQEHPEMVFEDIVDLDFHSYSGELVTPKTKSQLLDIFSQNYTEEPEFIDRFRTFLFGDGDEVREKRKRNTFYILERQDGEEGTVLSFMRLEEDVEDESKLYFAACNVNPDFRGSGIGGQMLKQVILEAQQTHTITATFPPDSPIGTFYISELGFVADGFHFELDTYPRFHMTTDHTDLPSPDILAANQQILDIADASQRIVLQKQLDDCSSVISFFGDAIKDKDGIFEFAQLLFGGGYVMTGHEVLSKQPTERSYHFVRKMG